MENLKNRLIFALVVPDRTRARKMTDLLGPHVGLFKIGLELFTSEGPHLAREIVRNKSQVFLDLKLHDIPKTVERTMQVISRMGVKFATVHTAGGADMLKAAVDGARGNVGVIGVTVLTSQAKAGQEQDIIKTVLERAKTAKTAGCSGIVCSGREAALVRKELGPEFVIICPGVRPEGGPAHDQKRVVTPGQAMENGADYLVVGRPIRDAKDPVAAAQKIVAQMEGG